MSKKKPISVVGPFKKGDKKFVYNGEIFTFSNKEKRDNAFKAFLRADKSRKKRKEMR